MLAGGDSCSPLHLIAWGLEGVLPSSGTRTPQPASPPFHWGSAVVHAAEALQGASQEHLEEAPPRGSAARDGHSGCLESFPLPPLGPVTILVLASQDNLPVQPL